MAKSGPAYETLQTLRAGGVGAGVLTPIEVLVPSDKAEAAAAAAAQVDGVRMAVVGGDKNGLAVIDVIPTKETVDSSGNVIVDGVRDAVEKVAPGQVGVTGSGATVEDYFTAVYDKFPYVLALIALITLVLLMRTFRSLLLPDQGGAAQPGVAVRGLRHGRVLLAARPRLGRDLRRRADRAPSRSGCP